MTIECNILIQTASREEMIVYIRKANPAYRFINFCEFDTEEIRRIYVTLKRQKKEGYVSFSKT